MTQYKKIYELAILTIFLIVSFALASCNSEDSGGSGTAATTTKPQKQTQIATLMVFTKEVEKSVRVIFRLRFGYTAVVL